MITVPFNEQFRLAVLEHFDVLDTPPEERFDRITRLASGCFDVPIAVISLVADVRQWFKSSVGIEEQETPREVSFCNHAIMNQDVFVVLDARHDSRFAENPLVTGETGIRFYAGAPLISAKGFRFGTLCLIDRKPRGEFGECERAMLSDLAAMVVDELYKGCDRPCDDTDGGWERLPDTSHRSPHPAEVRTFEQDQALEAQLSFIASLSHELRTPLNAIMGFSEAITRELFGPVGNARYSEYLGHIHASGAHLVRFIDAVLDHAKAQKGEIDLQESWVDVAAAMRSCRAMFTEQLRAGELEFFWSASKDLPLLKADPQLFKQMLVNVIRNSIKFTGPGGAIRVAATLGADDGLTVSVADTGIGIASEDLRAALLPFRQVRNAMTGKHGGTGLGLTLVKQFVELHDGELAMESQPGSGTTVALHFPAYRVA